MDHPPLPEEGLLSRLQELQMSEEGEWITLPSPRWVSLAGYRSSRSQRGESGSPSPPPGGSPLQVTGAPALRGGREYHPLLPNLGLLRRLQ